MVAQSLTRKCRFFEPSEVLCRASIQNDEIDEIVYKPITSRASTRIQTRTNYPSTILTFASEGKNQHPTQKPVALMEYLIATYSNPGDTVLDPTMGSGTTGAAARKLGRGFIGIEMDKKFFEIAVSRLTDEGRMAA